MASKHTQQRLPFMLMSSSNRALPTESSVLSTFPSEQFEATENGEDPFCRPHSAPPTRSKRRRATT